MSNAERFEMTADVAERSNTDLHVIFGAGQVGVPLALRLLESGKRVRVVRRGTGAVGAGVEMASGDAMDREFCIGAAMGARTVYHCMNPAVYSAKVWAEVVPRQLENLIAAARASGSRLVVLEGLYMLGRTGGKAMNENMPMNPCSKKGEIRARAAERLFSAHKKGEVSAVSGRASDFYGPRARLSYFGDPFWKPVMKGSKVRTPADPDRVHTYHYVPDVAAGLATLGEAPEEAMRKAWMLPCQPAETMRENVGRLSKYFGTKIKVGKLPRVVMKVAGIFMPMVREINEMGYQWDEPFIVDDRAFRGKFGLMPVDREEAAKATVEWARKTY
jgi:nucleoside-diphosphate-sugar epimerase